MTEVVVIKEGEGETKAEEVKEVKEDVEEVVEIVDEVVEELETVNETLEEVKGKQEEQGEWLKTLLAIESRTMTLMEQMGIMTTSMLMIQEMMNSLATQQKELEQLNEEVTPPIVDAPVVLQDEIQEQQGDASPASPPNPEKRTIWI